MTTYRGIRRQATKHPITGGGGNTVEVDHQVVSFIQLDHVMVSGDAGDAVGTSQQR